MYRRQMPSDELLSLVLLFFAMVLVFGMLASWKLIGVDTFDAEMIVYITLGGLSFIGFVTALVVFFIGVRKPFHDLRIDFKQRTIHLFYGLKEVSFDDIRLYSYNRRHRQVRLKVKWFMFGFSIDQMTTKQGVVLTEEVATRLGEGVRTVKPRILYNYHLVAASVLIGTYIVYAVVYGRKNIPFAGWRYIPTYYVLIGVVVLIALAYGIDEYRLMRQIRQITNNEDTGEN